MASPAVAMPVGLRPSGIAAPALGIPRIQTSTNELRVSGFLATEWGSQNLQNKGVALKPGGIAPGAFGTSYIWNLRQFLGAKGFDGLKVGEAFVSGGIKIVTPSGLDAPALGKPLVVNTTADQTAAPQGVAPPALGMPGVSPRTLWPYGIQRADAGFPRVQFPPQPSGWQSSTFGYGVVEYKTKHVGPQGVDGFGTGYPVVRDRALTIQHHASAVTTLFGDVRVRVVNQYLRAQGFDALAAGDWSEVRSTRRWLIVEGGEFAGYGQPVIRNKTPSLAPQGWSSLQWGSADVGWRMQILTVEV